MTTGERIRKLREAREWSQTDLAKRAGCTKQAVSMWESGYHNISRSKLQTIADIFNVDIDYLMGRTNMSSQLLNTEEMNLIIAYREMSNKEKDMLCRMCGVKRDAESTDSQLLEA